MEGSLNNEYEISTDKTKLDVALIHGYLSNESYWAKNISFALIQKCIEGSFCFGLYTRQHQALPAGRQVGFARVITDFATFGYLADVFIVQAYRGRGLSKLLMENIMNHP